MYIDDEEEEFEDEMSAG